MNWFMKIASGAILFASLSIGASSEGWAQSCAMPSREYNDLTNSVRGARTDNARIDLIQQSANRGSRTMTLKQMKAILKLIRSEDARLDAAVILYGFACDVSGWDGLYDLWGSSAKQRELDRRLEQRYGSSYPSSSTPSVERGCVMSSEAYDLLIDLLDNVSTGENKLNVLKLALVNSLISSDQAKNVLRRFGERRAGKALELIRDKQCAWDRLPSSYYEDGNWGNGQNHGGNSHGQYRPDRPQTLPACALPQNYYNDLIARLKRSSSDQARVEEVFRMSASDTLIVSQAKGILETFRGDEARGQVAVVLYSRVCDNGWSDVYSTFVSKGSAAAVEAEIARMTNTNVPTPSEDVVYVISDDSLNALLLSIKNANFEAKKMTVLQQAVDYNYFTVAQAKQVIQQFVHEQYRIDVAAMLYPKIVDRENWYQIYDVFTHISSSTKLNAKLGL